MENKFVAAEDLTSKLGSKKCLYEILNKDRKASEFHLTIVGLYLPPYKRWPVSFMKQILSKEKKVSKVNN